MVSQFYLLGVKVVKHFKLLRFSQFFSLFDDSLVRAMGPVVDQGQYFDGGYLLLHYHNKNAYLQSEI
jgi:hypothetical protein